MKGFLSVVVVISTLSVALAELDLLAFTVEQDQHLQFQDATTLQFSKTITNHHATNLVSSVFTCSAPGLYKFQVYSLTKTDTDLFLDLYRNDVIVASLWAHTPQDFASAGNAVILDLASGDTVQVKSHTSHNVSLYGTDHEIYTTFSGVQLGAYELGLGAQLAAFSVYLDHQQTVPGGAVVKFNKTYVDTDHSYNMNTGTFVSPNGGIFLLHFFALAQLSKMLWLELYHNTDYVASIYGKTTTERADAGNTVILHLRPGDRVQLRAREGAENTNDLFGQPDQIYGIFSGYELYQDGYLLSTSDGPKSYFSVGLSKGYTVHNGDKVIFDRVFTDPGDYNHVTGEFTAPFFGTYEFNYHALAENMATIALDLYHNYKYINSLFSHTPIDYGAAGNSAVLEMDKGDVVYIRARGENQLFADWDQVYCTFSGALLHSNRAKAPLVGK